MSRPTLSKHRQIKMSRIASVQNLYIIVLNKVRANLYPMLGLGRRHVSTAVSFCTMGTNNPKTSCCTISPSELNRYPDSV